MENNILKMENQQVQEEQIEQTKLKDHEPSVTPHTQYMRSGSLASVILIVYVSVALGAVAARYRLFPDTSGETQGAVVMVIAAMFLFYLFAEKKNNVEEGITPGHDIEKAPPIPTEISEEKQKSVDKRYGEGVYTYLASEGSDEADSPRQKGAIAEQTVDDEYPIATSAAPSQADMMLAKRPLILDGDNVTDPTGFRWTSDHLISTKIKVYAKQGQMDWRRIIARPGLGYPQYYGGHQAYRNVNQASGSTGWWDAWHESTGGNNWFWWKLSDEFFNWPENKQYAELELTIVMDNRAHPQVLPIGFSLTIPDLNFDTAGQHFMLWFHWNPFDFMPPYNHPNPVDKRKGPPLHLKKTDYVIHYGSWTFGPDHSGTSSLVIRAKQGGIDWENITGPQKNGSGFFSWVVDHNVGIHNNDQVRLLLRVKNTEQPPHFPAQYQIEVGDAHYRDRAVRATIVIPTNPYAHKIVTERNVSRRLLNKTKTSLSCDNISGRVFPSICPGECLHPRCLKALLAHQPPDLKERCLKCGVPQDLNGLCQHLLKASQDQDSSQ